MVVVPRDRKPEREDEIIIRRTGVWHDEHVAEVRGVPCLIPGRVVTDLAHLGADEHQLRDVGLALRRTTGMTAGDIAAVMDRYRRLHGRDLLQRLRDLLAMAGSDSGLEAVARAMLADAGLHPDELQVTVDTVSGRRRLDIVFLDARVGIEVQSVEYHGNSGAMTRDARKLNAFVDGDEWKVLLLTPEMLEGELWQEFLGVLRRLLAARG